MREPFDYLHQLKNKFPEDYLDSIQYELDIKIYYYGNQFLKNTEKNDRKLLQDYGRNKLVDVYKLKRDIKFSIIKNEKYAISGAYFGLEKHLNNFGIKTLATPWTGIQAGTWKQYNVLRKYQFFLSRATLLELLSDVALTKYNEVMDVLRTIYAKPEIRYLCIPNDMSPFEKMSVKIFRQLGKKSFIFLHGLPARYNSIDDNRSDYLVVWGRKIKDLYVNAGIKSEKIFISGHPRYDQYRLSDVKLKSGLENILLIGKSIGGQHSDEIRLQDRGNMLLYLWQIQSVLEQLGVTSVRFRPHPSMNINWFYDFIDKEFFKPDLEKNISVSLKSSSLVIGPTSSVLLDALLAGVNYLVYEPVKDHREMSNFLVVPPFDNSDPRVIVTQTEDQLKKALISNNLVDTSVVSDYIEPNFDLNFMESVID